MGTYSKNSSNIRTLRTVQDLQGVRFGHQFPRHGLKLLHWLADDIIYFDSNGSMCAKEAPSNGGYGFHSFHNNEKILPVQSQSRCFMVGNLHYKGAQDLPFEEAQSRSDESNTDRIILNLDSGHLIRDVYITEHTPHLSSFSAKYTYRLSKNLIQAVKDKSLGNFLRQAGYIPGPDKSISDRSNDVTLNMPVLPRDQNNVGRSSICSCVIL